MTPQEFFKKDLFAGKTGVELIEIKEGYSKARLVITEEHLNAGHRTQGGALFTLADLALGRSRQLSRRTVLFTVFQYHFPARQRCRRHIVRRSRERYVGRTTGYYQIDVTNQKGELIATFESSVFRKGDALPFTL